MRNGLLGYQKHYQAEQDLIRFTHMIHGKAALVQRDLCTLETEKRFILHKSIHPHPSFSFFFFFLEGILRLKNSRSGRENCQTHLGQVVGQLHKNRPVPSEIS